jgi:hypothetical protein
VELAPRLVPICKTASSKSKADRCVRRRGARRYNKLKLLEQIARRHSDSEIVHDTLSVTATLRELNRRRNTYIHSEYFAEYNDVNDFLGLKHREVRDFDKDLFSEGVLRATSRDQLEDFYSRLCHAAKELSKILKRLDGGQIRLG